MRKIFMKNGHGHTPLQFADRRLRLSEVKQISGLGKTKIYQLMRDGLFPKNYKYFGSSDVYWLLSEVLDWAIQGKRTRISVLTIVKQHITALIPTIPRPSSLQSITVKPFSSVFGLPMTLCHSGITWLRLHDRTRITIAIILHTLAVDYLVEGTLLDFLNFT
jgi:predicted DNA-binding transcriptional regulator AlpA